MNKLEIKGLTHKICFIDTLNEMYQVNINHMDVFTRVEYAKCGEKTLKHYDWLKSVYSKFDDAEKKDFRDLFSQSVHTYQLLNTTVNLSDDASVSDVREILRKSEVEEIRNINGLLENISGTYSKAYSAYFDSFKSEFDEKAEKILKTATENSFDILSFMEDNSGIRFSEFAQIAGFTFPDTIKYYFTFRPIGAMGFQTQHEIISTVQGNINDLTGIISTPFHEFSHFLFRTFTLFDDFKKISSGLKDHKELLDYWETKSKNYYDWDGWVEENLVEGYSKFLVRKYKELCKLTVNNVYSSYVIDKMFYDHLISRNFDSGKSTLKEASLEFLTNLHYQNLLK